MTIRVRALLPFIAFMLHFPSLFSVCSVWHLSVSPSRATHDPPRLSKHSCERHALFIRRAGEKGKARKCGPINCNCRVDSTNLFFSFFFFFFFLPNDYINSLIIDAELRRSSSYQFLRIDFHGVFFNGT